MVYDSPIVGIRERKNSGARTMGGRPAAGGRTTALA